MHSTKVRKLTLAALFAALTAVCSQIQIPLPMIPLNLALFSVHLCGVLLGAKYGAVSMAGLRIARSYRRAVFTGMGAGPAVLFGKTGGYIVGYVLAAAVGGLWRERFGYSFWRLCAGMALGTIACYALGTLWFMFIAHLDLITSLSYCVFPFLPGDGDQDRAAAAIALRSGKNAYGCAVTRDRTPFLADRRPSF